MIPLKIGIVCYPTYGGSGVVATELGKALANKGHEVHFIAYSQPFRLTDVFTENLYFHEVNVSSYPLFEHPPYILSLAGKLVDVVHFQQLDLIHVHYAIPHATAANLAKQILQAQGKNIPVITTLHGTDVTLVGKDPLFEPIVSLSINQSDGVTAVSNSLREETLKHFNIKVPIEVIPNFVDIHRFSRKSKEHFRKAIAPNNEPILVHTSNFRKVKRVDHVIQIFKLVNEHMPCKLLMVGDGPERAKVEGMARDFNIGDSIRFLGKQEAIEEILSVSDVFLMPSETESFGLAALEAMACELPVVSSNTGGLPEVNIDGQTGFTADPHDVRSMANSVIKLLENPELMARQRKNALEQAHRFSLENILPMYEQHYYDVLERMAQSVA